MQCTTDLVKLRDAIIARTRNLKEIVSHIRDPITPDGKRALAFVTIEADNLIVSGLRQYTKSSLLRSRTSAGVRIIASVQPSSSEEAAALVFKSLNPTTYQKMSSPPSIIDKNEITFRDPKKSEKVLNDYSASNINNLQLALSLNAEVFSEAKICRHFFAHRARNTYEAVQDFAANLGILYIETPEQLLLRGRPTSGVRIIDGWLSDIENFFDLAT